ncbi:MAG: TonB-dependent receptor, partial [Pseudomonadota bacterium]
TFGGFFNTGNEPDGVLTFDQSANNSDKTGAKLTYSHSDLAIEGLTLTGGLDYLEDETFQELIATGRLWVPETTLKSLAPFVQVDQSFLDGRGVVSFGVRYEDAEIEVGDYQTIFSSGAVDVGGGNPSFSETLYNAGASLEVLEGVKAYVSYGEVFTLPDVGRVLRAVSEPGLDVDNLLDVSPIVTDNIEVGVTVERGGLSANIAYFQSESDFGQRLALNDAGIFTVEREATEISGFEISADYVFDSVPLSIGAGYAALDGESDQDGDGSVETELDAVNIGPDRLNLFAEYEFSPAFSGRVQASSFLDKEFDDGRTDTDFDGYTLIDVIGIYDFGTIGTLQFGVQNLANEDYTTYFSQSSSQAVTRGDRFFQGRGRTFNLRWVNEF